MKRIIGSIGSIAVLWILIVFGSWAGNIYKLASCDFEAPYKSEIIHTIGLLPGVSLVTVWFD